MTSPQTVPRFFQSQTPVQWLLPSQDPHPIDLLLDAAGVGQGVRMLDLGAELGCVSSRAAAREAFPTGLAPDYSDLEEMRRQHPGVDFVRGEADDIPYPANVFDVVVSHFQMPYMSAPAAAMRESLRVLDGGGTFAFSAWSARADAPLLAAVQRALGARGGVQLPLNSGPHVFADPYRCARSLSSAGFDRVEVKKIPMAWSVPAGAPLGDAFAAALLPTGTAIKDSVISNEIESAEAELRAACEPFRLSDGAILIPMAAIVASGRKPK